MAKLANKPVDGPWNNESGDWERSYAAATKRLEELQSVSAAIDCGNPDVSLVGALVQFQVADGYAVYVVTKDSPLTLAHVPFGDCWTIPAAHIRGIERSDVIAQLSRAKAFREIFAKPE